MRNSSFKRLAALALMASFVFGITSCQKINFEKIDEDDFVKAAEEIDIDEDEIDVYEEDWQFRGSGFDEASYAMVCSHNDLYLTYVVFDDEDDAFDCFEQYIEIVEDEVGNRRTGNKLKKNLNEDDEIGYIIFNLDDGYGGYYYCEDTLLLVLAIEPSSRDIRETQTFLDELEYPYLED